MTKRFATVLAGLALALSAAAPTAAQPTVAEPVGQGPCLFTARGTFVDANGWLQARPTWIVVDKAPSSYGGYLWTIQDLACGR